MITFWKRKDKEINEQWKKISKAEKDMHRKEEEQKEQLMNKKRLEYIMRQSEAYTSFMAEKIGVKHNIEKREVEIFHGQWVEIENEHEMIQNVQSVIDE